MYRWDGCRSGFQTRAYDRLPRPNTEPNLLDTDTRRKTLLRFFQYNPTARNIPSTQKPYSSKGQKMVHSNQISHGLPEKVHHKR
jgi:hypothetical protein